MHAVPLTVAKMSDLINYLIGEEDELLEDKGISTFLRLAVPFSRK